MSGPHRLPDIHEAFQRDGFVAIPKFASPGEVAELVEHVRRYIEDVVPRLPPQEAFYEDKERPETLKQMHRMSTHDRRFREFLLEERCVELAEQLLGTPVAAQDVEYFHKPPGLGRETPPHQDGYYFMLEPNEAVTLWLALDAVDEHNGCMRYVADSHRKGIRPHASSGVLGFSQGITDYGPLDEALEAAAPADPGDILAHHSLTIHRADANRSERPRGALGLVYYSSRARRDVEKQAAYQSQLNEQLRREGKI